jgi:glycosyltransferase involved in cell wall biosynthesis
MQNSLSTREVPMAQAPPLGRRLRVLEMIGHLGDFGGAERLALGLATHLPHDRFETWVCAPRGGDADALAALADAGVPFVDLGRRGKLDAHRNRSLVGLLRQQRFDVLHSHMFGSNVWATVFGRLCGVPVLIAHEQTWSYEGSRLRPWIDGHVIGRLATRFVAVSSADAQRMATLEGVPREKITLIPNAYVPSVSSADTDVRAELGIDPSTPLVVSAVVMRPQKALDVLLAAHARIVTQIPDAHLALAGDGECREQLQVRARELGLESRVHFLGFRRDIDSILRSADVAALSSDFEGTPLFAFECMAARTPLVATGVGGLPDVIENGRTGLLVPRQRPQELADAIVRLLNDPALRERLADEAAAHLDTYTIENITRRFATLYEALSHKAAGQS